MKQLGAARRFGAVALTGAITVAAAGASALTIEQIAEYKGADRQSVLEEGAKKEGEILWIGTLSEQTSGLIVKAFNGRYPGIKVGRIRSDGPQALQRVLAEHRARTPRVDLMTSGVVPDLKAAGLVQTFLSPALDAYAPEDKDPNRVWGSLYNNYHGVAAYNTSQVPAAEAPRTYADLLDPKWKDKMVWGNSVSTGAPFFITYQRLALGEEKALGYLEKLARQQVVTRNTSARTVIDMTAAGEHQIMINPVMVHVAALREKGAPVDVVMQDPVPTWNTTFVLLKTAPHPHASMLLVDFLVGKEGQTVLREAGYFPAHPDVDPLASMQALEPKAKGFKKLIVDEELMTKMTDKSDEIFKKLFN